MINKKLVDRKTGSKHFQRSPLPVEPEIRLSRYEPVITILLKASDHASISVQLNIQRLWSYKLDQCLSIFHFRSIA